MVEQGAGAEAAELLVEPAAQGGRRCVGRSRSAWCWRARATSQATRLAASAHRHRRRPGAPRPVRIRSRATTPDVPAATAIPIDAQVERGGRGRGGGQLAAESTEPWRRQPHGLVVVGDWRSASGAVGAAASAFDVAAGPGTGRRRSVYRCSMPANLYQSTEPIHSRMKRAHDVVAEDLEVEAVEPVPEAAAQVHVAGEDLQELDAAHAGGHEDAEARRWPGCNRPCAAGS